MWFETSPDSSCWTDAARHLCRVDPILREVIRRTGPCMLAPRRDYFVALCRSVFAQQLSIRVAQVLFDRFRDQFPARRPTPEAAFRLLRDCDPQVVRACGLSRQKATYIRDLAEHFADERIPTRRLSRMSDEQIIEALTQVRGIGRWTAEMFLMFVLNRPDVLPVDDLGLREGFRELYGLKARPTAKEMIAIAEPWRPYRSVGSWYIWRRHQTKTAVNPPAPSPPGRASTTRRRGVARRTS